jgi:N-acetylneuraminic acid mutarotase
MHIEFLENRICLSTALQWQTVASSPMTRAEGTKATVNGDLYVVGGFINSQLQVSKELDRYDPAANTWTRLADMPVPETHGASAVFGNDIWIAGFFYNNGVTASNLVYMYDTVANTWTQEPSLPGARGAVGAAILGDELHVWGGLTGKTTSAADHWALNLDDLSAGWQTLAPLPQPLDHVGSLALDGELWSIGGFQDKEETNGNLNVVYRYDPTTNQWSTNGVAQLPEGLGHIGPDTTVAGDDIIIAGGQIDASFEDEITQVLEYDSSANQWITLTSLPGQRKSAFCVFADGKLIVSCGNQPTAPYESAVTWVADFDPDASSSTGGSAGSGTPGGGTGSSGGSGSSGSGGTSSGGTGSSSGSGSSGGGTASGGAGSSGDGSSSGGSSGAGNSGGTGSSGDGGSSSGGTSGGSTSGSGGTGSNGDGSSSSGGTGSSGDGGTSSGSGNGGSSVPALPSDPNGPDLTGTIRAHLVGQVIAGDKGDVSVTVINDGTGDAFGKFNITLVASPDASADDAVQIGADVGRRIHLKHDQKETYAIHFQLPADLTDGSYTILALIDSGNAFIESNEMNNTVNGPTVAVAAQVHDIAAADLSVKATLSIGKSAHVDLDLLNAGNMSETGEVMLTLSATLIGSSDSVNLTTIDRHLSLEAGRKKSFSIPLRVPAGWAGQYQFTATVTPITLVDDDQGDNTAGGEIEVEA